MIRTTPLTFALSAAIVLAACSSGGGNTLRAGLDTPRVQLSNCENFGGNFAVPFDQAQAALPDGFEPLPTTGGSAAGAVFFITAVRCPQGSLDGQDLGEVIVSYAELPVTPGEAFAVEGHNDYVVPIFFTATPDVLADAFVGARFGEAGRSTITWTNPTPGSTDVQVTLGNGSYGLTGSIPPEPVSEFGAGEFILYGVQERTVRETVLGYYGGSSSVRGPVNLSSTGGPPLLGAAARTSRGFANTGFDFGFSLP